MFQFSAFNAGSDNDVTKYPFAGPADVTVPEIAIMISPEKL
jgi:hypothetical protein